MPNARHATHHTDQAHPADRSTRRRWLEMLSRICYVAKGGMYLLTGAVIGYMAIVSRNAGSPSPDVLQSVTNSPLGRLLLALTALASLCFLVWRLLQAILDTESKGADPVGCLQRFGYVVSAAAHGGFALVVARFAFGFQVRKNNTIGVTANVMSVPLGQVLVALVGVGVLVVAGYQVFRAVTGQFGQQFDPAMSNTARYRFIRWSGRFGLIAHGIALGAVGQFLVIAALQQQLEPTQGLGDAFQALSQQPFGPFLLGLFALCSFGYGIFLLVEARYR